MEDKYAQVQYIVVRKDLIVVDGMGMGKLAAQVAHASLGVVLPKQNDLAVQEWLKGSFVKLVCYVKTKEKLLGLKEKLDNDGLFSKLIHDSCRTELQPEEDDGSTLTCLGVIPMHRDNVPKYLKKLQLL